MERVIVMLIRTFELLVKTVVFIITVTGMLLRALGLIVTDTAKKAKETSPSIKDHLKTVATEQAMKAPSVVNKFDSKIRKALNLEPHQENVDAIVLDVMIAATTEEVAQ